MKTIIPVPMLACEQKSPISFVLHVGYPTVEYLQAQLTNGTRRNWRTQQTKRNWKTTKITTTTNANEEVDNNE